MSLSSIPRPLRERIAARDAGRCRYCSLVQVGQAAVFHIDHVVPRSRGGATDDGNRVLQCPHCSLHKSNKHAAPDPQTGIVQTLFHPLQQAWVDRFLLSPDGTCVGQTPVGRATAEALAMNHTLPRAARAFQVSLGLLTPSPTKPQDA